MVKGGVQTGGTARAGTDGDGVEGNIDMDTAVEGINQTVAAQGKLDLNNAQGNTRKG